MNVYAFLIGIIIVFGIIFHFKKTRLERTHWAYPLLLGTFPLYYFVFALYAWDINALMLEALIGTLFLIIAYVAYKSGREIAALFVGIGCMLHGIYDVYHDSLFINEGMPNWWAEFCGSIDLVLGGYLIYFSLKLKGEPES